MTSPWSARVSQQITVQDGITQKLTVVVSDESRLSFPLWFFRRNRLIARLRIPSRFGPMVASFNIDSGSEVKNGGSETVDETRGAWDWSLDLRSTSCDLRAASLDPRPGGGGFFSSFGVLGRLGRSWCPVSFLDAIHFVFVMSSRATGNTGTNGCWNATLTQPRQFRPDGMN